MKNISRQLFTVLTFVCLIALVVFLVQLIIINRDEDSREPGSVVTEGSHGDEDQAGDEPSTSPPPTVIETTDPTTLPPPEGTRWEIPVDTAGTVLVLYADEEQFDYVENDLNWQFVYKGGGSCILEIGIEYLPLQGVSASTEVYLNERIGGDEAEYKGEQQIAGSPLTGYSVGAVKDGITYEAWLYRLSGSELAVALLINYEFNGQRDDLYAVLSSINIEQG